MTWFSHVISIFSFINLNYIAGIEKFKKYNRLTMCEEVLKELLEITQVVEIFNNWGLGSST